MPGYINEIGEFLLEDCQHCTLNYNPEFIAQGDIIQGFFYPDNSFHYFFDYYLCNFYCSISI